MDPNYNWSSQAYPNGQYAQYAQPNGYQQPQLQPQYQQQHAHQHQHQPGYPQAYPQQYSQNVSLQPSSGYAPPQLFHGHPQAPPLHQASQHYPGMIQPMPQQIQMNRHQQVPMNHQQQVDIGYQQQMQINHQQQMQVNHQQQMQVNHQRQIQVSHQQQRQTNNHQQPNFRQQESPKTNQQPQINRQQQQKPRAQPQVVVPARTPNPATYIQVQPPQIQQNETQDPLQRAGNEKNLQPSSTTPAAKPLAKTQLHQENKPRPQQRPSNTPIQKHSQYRAPLQPHSVPHQPASSQKQTPVKQHRSPSLQDPSPRPKSHPKVVITKPTSHQLTPTKHVHTQRQQLPADLSVMLLSAADEYITAARSMSVATMRDKKYANRQQYQQLMATAMGCMDTVLKDFNLQPRDEAKLRLRYASLLIEETDNATDIEEILSKQISLCGRFRLHDLKYATFHLQARYQSKTNHRAAIKSLGKPISEAETFQHIAWVYALRFLKVSLTLQAPGRIEAIPALQQLNSILAHAQKHGDRAIYVACYALEAMVHLRSTATDRLEQAQRSIAAARSLQLELSEAQLGSFGTLIDLIDIACGVQQGAPNHTKQSALDKIMTDKSEKSDNVNAGICTVLIEKSFGGSLTSDTGGIFQRSVDGRDELVFSWLPREDMQALCFYISALDQSVHEKGSRFIEEAHSRSRESLKCQPMHCIPVCVAQSRADWLRLLNWYNVFTYGLISLSRNNQSRAKEALSSLKGQIRQHPYNNQDSFVRTLSYLSAVVDQSDGRLDSALRTYSSKELALEESTPAAGCKTDISILSAMNRFLIVRDPAHVEHHTANALLAILQPVSTNHPNQYIRTAYRILQGITSDNVTINRQKTQMQMASNQARDVFTATNNVEFVIMALSIFTSRFFVDASNWAQAMNATRRIAMKSGKPLWIAVASGLCIMAYQRNGLLDDAQKAQADYELVRPKLPAPLRGEPEDIDAKGEDDEI